LPVRSPDFAEAVIGPATWVGPVGSIRATDLPLFVTTGLDPVVHAEMRRTLGAVNASKRRVRMDCRVKPSNDEMEIPPRIILPRRAGEVAREARR
jgi:hypothetical protein